MVEFLALIRSPLYFIFYHMGSRSGTCALAIPLNIKVVVCFWLCTCILPCHCHLVVFGLHALLCSLSWTSSVLHVSLADVNAMHDLELLFTCCENLMI